MTNPLRIAEVADQVEEFAVRLGSEPSVDGPAIACTLDADRVSGRIDEWNDLLNGAAPVFGL